jgi:sigma-B regulation protein RsbQ
MWRFVAPAFEKEYQIVLFDHIGCGRSDISEYSAIQYQSLDRYATDILEIVDELNLRNTIFVGHSVSSMIGVLAAIREPSYISKLILIGPSPCYVNQGDYIGGHERDDIEGMLSFLDENYIGWAQAMAPTIMGNLDKPELGAELTESFCSLDPTIAKQFARVTFLSDNRADLPAVQTPSLVMQCSNDPIAPDIVGKYVHDHIEDSVFVKLQATGHCPNMSAPEETSAAIKSYLQGSAAK